MSMRQDVHQYMALRSASSTLTIRPADMTVQYVPGFDNAVCQFIRQDRAFADYRSLVYNMDQRQ
jgi:hypothetical protein